MKNKNGFSLLGLIKMIVILALIFLVAAKVIVKMIKESKENSNLSSVESHIKNIEGNLGMDFLNNMSTTGEYEFDDLGIKNYPKNDKVRCASYKIDIGKVKEARMCNVGNKNYCYKDGVVEDC